MRKRIIYLAGPMKGMPEKNHPLFIEVTRQLREAGHRVYSPQEYPSNGQNGFDIRRAFASYATFICLEADTLVLLPGWENSLGATCERALAENCRDIEILEWKTSWDILGCGEELTA